jgi:Rieske Fe-S protein
VLARARPTIRLACLDTQDAAVGFNLGRPNLETTPATTKTAPQNVSHEKVSPTVNLHRRPHVVADVTPADSPHPAGRTSRRHLLIAAGASAGAALLAACGRQPGTSGAGSNGGQGSGSTGTKGTGLIALSQLPVDASEPATAADGAPLVVARPAKSKVVAFSAICTHQQCTVQPAGKQYICPCHGSRYDAFTGKVLQGPATKPLAPVKVKVKGGEVVPG